MTTTPTREPQSFISGDSVTWGREDLVDDYPAPTWSASYALRGTTGQGLTKAATADGAAFVFALTAAETAALPAGTYGYTVTVTDGTQRHTVARGSVEIIVDLAALALGDAHDPRGHLDRLIDALEATLEGRATKDQQSYTIAGRTLDRIPLPDVRALLNSAYARRTMDKRKARAAAGHGRGDQVRGAF